MSVSNLEILKKLVEDYYKTGSGDFPQIFEKCKKHINSLIMQGLNSTDIVVKDYCAEAIVMGINYDTENSAAMHVSFDILKNAYSFHINPVACVNVVNKDTEVYFIVAHEITHLLNKHFHRYTHMMKDDVVNFLLNIAMDVEVNTIVDKAFGAKFGLASAYLPSSAVVPRSISQVLLYDGRYIDVVKNMDAVNSPKRPDEPNHWACLGMVERDINNCQKQGYMMADYVFKLLDTKMKVCLGFDSSEMVEKFAKLPGIRFINEIYRVVSTGKSKIFEIPKRYEKDAKEFCTWISQYVQNTITCYLIAGGGDGSGSGDGKEGISGIFLSSGSGVYEVTEADLDGGIDEFIEGLLEGASNISGLSRGVGSFGTHDIKFKKEETIINWKSVLRNRLTYSLTEKSPTKKRVNRRQPTRLELSGVKSNKLINLYVAVDESGSISDDDYNYFLSELLSVAREFPCELTIIEFTFAIEGVTHYSRREVNRLFRSGNSLFTSRHSGGTAFQPIFNEIQENKKLQTSNLLVILTDGDAEAWVDFKGVGNRLWVSTTDGISCREEKRNVYALNRQKKGTKNKK